MSENLDGTAQFNRATRVPLEAVVRLHFEGEVSYQNGFSANVSATGMFVKHPEPHEVGSRLVFEFLVGTRRRPVQGVGVVTWVRAKYEGPGKPAGMGIAFEELDAGSREHLTEALFEFLEESLGGNGAPDAEPPPAEPPPGEPFRVDADLGTAVIAAPEIGDAPEPLAPTADAWAEAAEPAGTVASEATSPASPAELAPWPEPAPIVSELRDWHSSRELLQPPVPEEPHAAEPWEEEAESAPPPSRRPVWMLPAALLAVAAVAAGAWFWYAQGQGTSATTAGTSAAAAGSASPAPIDAEATAVPAPVASAEPTFAPTSAPTSEPLLPTVAASLPRFGVLREIDVRGESGATVVELRLDGSVAAGDYSVAAMPGDNPRLLVKLRRTTAPFSGRPPRADTAELRGVRIGNHQVADGSETHVVLDLAAADPRRAEVTPAGDRLLVRLPAGG